MKPFMASVEIQGPFDVLSNPVRIKADDRKPVEAGRLVTSVSVTINGDNAGGAAEKIVNGSGLKDRDNDELMEHTELSSDMWLSGKIQATDYIEFDLGKPQKLDLVEVWNYNQQWHTKKGVNKVDIKVWTESKGWEKILNDVVINEADGNNDYDEPTIIKLNNVEAAKVRFDDLTSHGGFDNVGLSEVRFYTVIGPDAINPQPAHRSKDVALCDLELKWTPGLNAVAHNLYLGTDPDQLKHLGKIENASSAKLSRLASDKKYFWRVDEVQTDGSAVTGELWNFDTGNLVGWWKLDETEGDIAADSSSNQYVGKLQNEPNWCPTGGKIGGALEFDGEDDYVEVDFTDDLAKWTISIWVKSPEAPTSDNPSCPLTRENNFQINWNHVQDAFRGAAGVNVNGQWYAATFGDLEADTWYHLVATYNGENLKAYKNGSIVSNNSGPSGNPEPESQTLKFGKQVSNPWFFKGLIDDVRIYGYDLSRDDIKMIYSGKDLSDVSEVAIAK